MIRFILSRRRFMMIRRSADDGLFIDAGACRFHDMEVRRSARQGHFSAAARARRHTPAAGLRATFPALPAWLRISRALLRTFHEFR